MKKLLTSLLVLITLIIQTNIVLADSFNAVVESKKATAGDEVEIKISLENNSGLIAALFNVEYDKERLELIEVTDGQLLEGGTFSPDCKAYPYKMVWNSASHTNFTDNGTLAILKFKVLSDARSGNAFINLSYSSDDIFDVDLNNVSITVKNGGIEVNEKKSSTNTSSGGGGSRPHSSSVISSGEVNTKTGTDVKNQIILTIGKKDALVFGETKSNDVAPIIRNDRTMLPARFVAESLGAAVNWDEDNRRVIITNEDTEIIITIDSQTALVNGTAIVLDSPAFIENDRTYTPLRFIVENLGASVEWNEKKQEVMITK